MASFIDIHPHIISDDESRYPPAPLFGKRSDWSQERPTTVETLIAAMDQAGVAKAAVVHSSTTYGYDNSYVVDGCAKYPDRLVAVGSVDVLQPDAPATIRKWVDRGLAGLRLFTGGSTKDFDPSEPGEQEFGGGRHRQTRHTLQRPPENQIGQADGFRERAIVTGK